MNARTTLADERRYRRALLQSQTVVQEEQAYDSSSDEEDVPPPPPLDPPSAGTAAAAAKEQAALAAAYTGSLLPKKARRAPRLTPAVLVHDETGLGRLLHQQPRLAVPAGQNASIPAAAAYTRRLFGHYEGAVRIWTDGHVQDTSAWMTAIARQSSTKAVKEHLQALRYVMRKQYVDQACGPVRAERLLEEWAAAEHMPLGDDYDEPVAQDDADGAAGDEGGVEETTLASTTAAGSPTATRGISPAPAPISPPDDEADDDDDDEVEFDMPTEHGPAKAKRRVLDDDSDDEAPPAKRPAFSTQVNHAESDEESARESNMVETPTLPHDSDPVSPQEEVPAGDERLPTQPTLDPGSERVAAQESLTVTEHMDLVTDQKSPVLDEASQSPPPSQRSPSQQEVMDLGQPSPEDYGTQAFLTQDDSRLSFFSVDSPAAQPRHADDRTSPAGDAAPEERVPEDTATRMDTVVDVPTQIMDQDTAATQLDTELSVAPQDTDVPTQMDSMLDADVPTQLASQDPVSPEKVAVLACDAATPATLVLPLEAADSCQDAMED
jgi:hypothetical protein